MSVIVHRFGNRKASIIQCLEKKEKKRRVKSASASSDWSFYLHIGKLLHGRKARQVEPGHVLPVFVIISLVLQISEGGATQPVKFQRILLPIWTCNNIDVYRR